jgi:excisionase family DNA binding protein
MRRLTISEAAERVETSAYTIRKGIRTGRFPAIMLGGRYLIDDETLDACLRVEAEENQRKAREACSTNSRNMA